MAGVILALGLGLAAAGAQTREGAVAAEPAATTGRTPPDAATPEEKCLSRLEQKVKTATRAVVPLSKALRAAKGRRSELLGARLCERDGKLVYLLTLLARDGKVLRATVDAGNGTLVGGR